MKDVVKKIMRVAIEHLKKKWWYIVLIIVSSLYVFYYRFEIYELKDLNARSLIFIMWLILLILPLFSEIEIGNVKIKKEVEKIQSELKNIINDLRMQIIEMQVSNVNNSNTIMVEQLASEHELNFMKNYMNQSHKTVEEDKKSEQELYLSEVRRTLKKELVLLCREINVFSNATIEQLIHLAMVNELIDRDTSNILQQINVIASRSLHGEIVSNEYVLFVKEVFPEIRKKLKEIRIKTLKENWYTCPRCFYSGPSKFENECPRCGFVSDDE